MGHAPPAHGPKPPIPMLLVAPETRRKLDSRARARFDQTLEELYGTWAYWRRRREYLKRQPIWIRRRLKAAISEACNSEENASKRIQSLWRTDD